MHFCFAESVHVFYIFTRKSAQFSRVTADSYRLLFNFNFFFIAIKLVNFHSYSSLLISVGMSAYVRCVSLLHNYFNQILQAFIQLFNLLYIYIYILQLVIQLWLF